MFLFPNNIVILSLKIVFVLTDSVDPEVMSHYVAFDLSLHCFQKYTLRIYMH